MDINEKFKVIVYFVKYIFQILCANSFDYSSNIGGLRA